MGANLGNQEEADHGKCGMERLLKYQRKKKYCEGKPIRNVKTGTNWEIGLMKYEERKRRKERSTLNGNGVFDYIK